MKTSQWIKDVKTVIGCEPPQLFKVLGKIADEDSDRGLFVRECQTKIFECIKDVKLFLGEIRRNAQDFTLHDITHCINVIDFMGQMLVDVDKLNPAEISFFIYSALLHDIGMVKLPDEEILLNDLREDHGDRSAQFIKDRVLKNSDDTQFHFGDYDYVYMEYLPIICASHMHEFSFIEKLPESFILDGMEVDMTLCAILLRLADAMDLKRNRAPYQLYQFLVNRTVSPDHWKKHMSISNCQVNEKGIFRVDGICHDEAAHRCLYNHLDTIESEIEKVFKWKIGIHPRLRLSSQIVERNINTQGYKMWHHSFSMDVLKITNLLMGEQLYGDKKLGLREIIQNSIDACMIRDEMNKRLGAEQDYTYKPEIYIIFDRENNQVIIRDNGTGMNEHIIQNYFLNIGASYYSSREFEKENLKYNPSGYFGIGFLACFMLSDDVYVRTAHWQEDKEYELHFIKSDKFVTKTEKPKTFSGTEIKLNLDQFMEVFNNQLSDIIINNDFSNEDYIAFFLYQTFWKLNIARIDNNIILCVMREESFIDYAKKKVENNSNYIIDLSEYLKGVEGIIKLSNSDLFEKISCFNNIGEDYALEALRKGEVNISNNIKDYFQLIRHLYKYSPYTNKIIEIDDDDINSYNSYILFTTNDCTKKIDDSEFFYTSDINKIKEYIKIYNWNCLCIRNEISYEDAFYIFLNIESYHESLSLGKVGAKEVINQLGYYPLYFINISNLVFLFNNMIYPYDNEPDSIWSDYKGKYWLKQARIRFINLLNSNIRFNYFKIEDIIMRISNSLIIPNSSRKYIIESSQGILRNAIFLCIYLWIYDQIKTEKKAIKSAEIVKQIILEAWDESVEGLFRPEKKPV